MMIEPVREFVPYMEKICIDRPGAVIISAAAGNSERMVEMSVTSDKSTSSLLPIERGDKREVPMVRVDKVCLDHQCNGPFVIKVDVQGSEIGVVEGCEGILEHTLAIILEVSFFSGFFKNPIFDILDVMNFMKTKGFIAYDIVGGHNRPLDGARAQADVVFVQENGPLRANHHWATSEQVKLFLETKRQVSAYAKLME